MPEPVAIEVDDKEVKPEIKPEVKPEAKKEEPQYVKIDELKKLSKQLDGISVSLRASEKDKKALQSKLDELETRLSGRSIKPSEAQDELDKLLEQGDWRTPVKRVTEDTVLEILKRREAENATFQQQEEKTRILEASKKQVREKYKDIDDPESEHAKAYMKILNEKPHYLKSEFGPLLAMRDMEDILNEEVSEEEGKESLRRARASAASLRPGSPAKSDSITLTREQKAFCKQHEISEEKYLATLKSMNNRQSEAE